MWGNEGEDTIYAHLISSIGPVHGPVPIRLRGHFCGNCSGCGRCWRRRTRNPASNITYKGPCQVDRSTFGCATVVPRWSTDAHIPYMHELFDRHVRLWAGEQSKATAIGWWLYLKRWCWPIRSDGSLLVILCQDRGPPHRVPPHRRSPPPQSRPDFDSVWKSRAAGYMPVAASPGLRGEGTALRGSRPRSNRVTRTPSTLDD